MSNELVVMLAQEQGLSKDQYWKTVCSTVMPQGATVEQILAFLAVAKQHGLNPLTREIYAFPSKGGIQPIVGVDGWLKLANDNRNFDGMETTEIRENGAVVAVTCKVYRKDRAHPVSATEYLSECKRDTEPWKRWPVRMLTNKAMIQALRRAFSFSGIVDPDEGERIAEAQVISVETVKDATMQRVEALKDRLAEQQPAAPASDEDQGVSE